MSISILLAYCELCRSFGLMAFDDIRLRTSQTTIIVRGYRDTKYNLLSILSLRFLKHENNHIHFGLVG